MVSFTPAPTRHHEAWVVPQRKTRVRSRPRLSPTLPVFELSTQNRFSPLRETERDAVIIGDSIVRHVRATLGKSKVHSHCFPGARVSEIATHVPEILNGDERVGTVVLHAGVNDIRMRQTEILKKDFRNLIDMLMVFLAVILSVVLVCGCSQDGDMPADCSDLYKAGQKLSGIYAIYPAGDVPVWVYCHMVSDGKDEDNRGWTVIQRRMDGSVNFYRPWNQYKRGFGNVESEYWLGLENMYQLTRKKKYVLRVDMEDFPGRKGFALYSSFSVDCETDGYQLHVSGFKDGGAGDSLIHHNDQKFSTFDKDQDSNASNCAKQYLGAFCWKNNFDVSMKTFIMKIKAVP
ncbi:unnamed protein product [Leuciscus chuanchicus]